MMIPFSLLDLSQSRKLSVYQLHTTLYTRKLFETRLSQPQAHDKWHQNTFRTFPDHHY